MVAYFASLVGRAWCNLLLLSSLQRLVWSKKWGVFLVIIVWSRYPHDDLSDETNHCSGVSPKLRFSILFLVTEVLNDSLWMVMFIKQNLGIYNSLSVFTSSTTSLHLHFVRNMLLEPNIYVGVGQFYYSSTPTFSISVVVKTHCDVSLTRYYQFSIAVLIIHRYRWCFGRRIWDPSKLRNLLKQLHDEIERRKSVSETK